MTPVYLGIFSKIFEWIWDNILRPIVEFFGELLRTLLNFLFESVLKPLLVNVFFPLFKLLAKMVFDILVDVLFEIYVKMLQLVDLMQELFNIFGGISPVKYKGEDSYLLLAIFNMSPIMRTVWVLIAIAFILLLMFSMISVIRSIGELGNEVQRPLAKVMRNTFSGFFKIISIPMLCVFLLLGTTVVLQSVSKGLTAMMETSSPSDGTTKPLYRGSKTTLGRTIFVVSTLNAANTSSYNITHSSADMGKIGLSDNLRAKYYYVDAQKYNGNSYVNDAKDYWAKTGDKFDARNDFDIKEIDYLIGIALGLLFLYTLFRGALSFIQRLFNILLLTLAGPIMGSTIPLDDGKKYEGWKELYIGEFFSAFGLLMGMEIYMMLVPMIMDGNISFGNGTVEANYLIRLVMLAGGAFMVKEVGPIITGFISSAAANIESTSNQMMIQKATQLGGEAWDYTKAAFGKIGSGGGGSKDKQKAKEQQDKENADKDEKSGKTKSDKDGNKGPSGGKGKSDNKAKEKEKEKEEKKEKENKEKENSGKENDKENDKDKDNKKEGEGKSDAGVKKSWLGGLIVKGKGADGKTHWGVNLGSKVSFGLRKDGTVGANVFGIGYKRGKDGKVDKVSIPFMRLKRGANGKMQVSKVKILKGLQFRRTEVVDKDGKRTMGGMYCSDLSVIGMKKRFDKDTGKVETISKLGKHFAKNEDGEYVMTHRNILGTTSVYDRDKAGKYHVVARRGFTSNRSYKLDKETGKRTLVSLKSFGGRSLYEDTEAEDDDDEDTGDGNTGTTTNEGADKKEDGGEAKKEEADDGDEGGE